MPTPTPRCSSYFGSPWTTFTDLWLVIPSRIWWNMWLKKVNYIYIPLKLVDQFIYLSSYISSTESIGKAWIAIGRLLWKSYLYDKTKWKFFKTNMDTNKTHGKKASCKLHKNAACYFEKRLETTTVRPLTSHHTNHQSKMSKISWVLLEKQGWTPTYGCVG